jgi:xylulokinase
MSSSSSSRLALGLDLSTQQLKIVAIDINNLETFYEKSLTFATDLAHYNTTKGVYSNEQEQTVNSPVEMWVEAVDVILDKMKQDDFPFERVAVISGAGQVPSVFSASSFNSNMHLSSGRLRQSVFSRN